MQFGLVFGSIVIAGMANAVLAEGSGKAKPTIGCQVRSVVEEVDGIDHTGRKVSSLTYSQPIRLRHPIKHTKFLDGKSAYLELDKDCKRVKMTTRLPNFYFEVQPWYTTYQKWDESGKVPTEIIRARYQVVQ